MVPHTTIDHTLIAGEDMILQTVDVISHTLDPAHRIVEGIVTGHTHHMMIIPLILTTEGTGIGQFPEAFHQRQGFLVDIIPEVTLLSLGEER